MENERYEVWPKDYFSGKYCRNCRFLCERIVNGNKLKACAYDGKIVEPSDTGCNKFEP